MAEYGTMDIALAGLLYGYNHDVESAIAQEDIAFGAPVFGFVGSENKCYGPHKDKITTLLSADLVASNVITSVINGISVANTFATDHATTMAAHIAAINAKAELITLGISAVVGGTNRGIVISGPAGLDLTMTQVVTLGASQATATITYGTNGKFLGAACFIQTGGNNFGAGTSSWKNKDSVSILRDGKIWVLAESTVADKDAAYVSIGTGTLGKFSDVSTANYDIGGYFRSTISGGLAVLEVRGLK
jgi:hypothetical protein